MMAGGGDYGEYCTGNQGKEGTIVAQHFKPRNRKSSKHSDLSVGPSEKDSPHSIGYCHVDAHGSDVSLGNYRANAASTECHRWHCSEA